MIDKKGLVVCPRCLKKFNDSLVCSNCGYKVLYDNGVFVFPSQIVKVFSSITDKIYTS
jgi:DNA-directed RNA polymerase subunit RPC12/RpoP